VELIYAPQEYNVWKHAQSGEYLVRTTSYSLPIHLHAHIVAIQPTTMFGRVKRQRSFVSFPDPDEYAIVEGSEAAVLSEISGLAVDASCNRTVTLKCLQQLYNSTGYVSSDSVNNSIGITGYLVGPYETSRFEFC